MKKNQTLIDFVTEEEKQTLEIPIARVNDGVLRMIVSQNMVAEAEIICQQSLLDVKCRRVQIDVGSPPASSPSFGEVCVAEAISNEVKRFESVCEFCY